MRCIESLDDLHSVVNIVILHRPFQVLINLSNLMLLQPLSRLLKLPWLWNRLQKTISLDMRGES